METGTEIILQRMKDCPEDFSDEGGYHGKWGRIIQDAREYLPTKDVEALDTTYKQLLIDRYNEKVLRTLAGEVEPESNAIYKSKGLYATGFTDARALLGGAVAKGEGQMINEHLDTHREAILRGALA